MNIFKHSYDYLNYLTNYKLLLILSYLTGIELGMIMYYLLTLSGIKAFEIGLIPYLLDLYKSDKTIQYKDILKSY